MLKERHGEIFDFLKEYLFPITIVSWFILENLQLVNFQTLLFGHSLAAYDRYVDWAFLGVLLFIFVFLKDYSEREKIILGIATLFFAIPVYISGYRSFLSMWLFIVDAKGEDFDRILKWAYWLLLTLTAMVVLLFLVGVLHEVTGIRSEIVVRHSLGFIHPNTLGMNIMQLVLYRLYLHRNRITIWDVLLALANIVFTYLVPNSRTAYICMAFAMILMAIYYLVRKQRICKSTFLWTLVAFCIFCNFFCVITSVVYSTDSTILEKLNSLMTGRIALSNKVYNQFGLSIFGTNLPEFQSKVKINGTMFDMPTIDSTYMNLLLRFGIIAYVLHTFLYLGTAIWARKNNPMLLIMFTVYASNGVMEKSVTEMRHNLFLLAMSLFIFSKDFGLEKRVFEP